MRYDVIEKDNPLHLHAVCSSMESAVRWITELAPVYCARGYFMDKTLTPSSFKVVKRD